MPELDTLVPVTQELFRINYSAEKLLVQVKFPNAELMEFTISEFLDTLSAFYTEKVRRQKVKSWIDTFGDSIRTGIYYLYDVNNSQYVRCSLEEYQKAPYSSRGAYPRLDRDGNPIPE